jgi:hypothetical protein
MYIKEYVLNFNGVGYINWQRDMNFNYKVLYNLLCLR